MSRNNSYKLLLLALSISALLAACSTLAASPTIVPPTEAPVEVLPTNTSIPTPAPTKTPTIPPPTPTETTTAQNQGFPLTLEDSLGRTVTLDAPAQRIVSLAPSNTEILFAIGAGDQLVGRDAFSDYPAEAVQIADVGGGWGDLNLETIVSLQPDLVLAAELSPPEQIQSLESLGLTVYLLKNPIQLEGMYANLLTVGQITGHEEEAAALVQSLKQRVAAVEDKLATVETRPLVFYELDSTEPNAPWTAGPGTFIDTLISMAHGENLGNVLQSDWGQISVEELLTQDPDFIILGDYTWGGVTVEDVEARAGWETLQAVKNDHVYTFDDNLVSRPGPRMVDGLEAMAELLHPEAFR
jgi:iron complex transport system substrate-binding protein